MAWDEDPSPYVADHNPRSTIQGEDEVAVLSGFGVPTGQKSRDGCLVHIRQGIVEDRVRMIPKREAQPSEISDVYLWNGRELVGLMTMSVVEAYPS